MQILWQRLHTVRPPKKSSEEFLLLEPPIHLPSVAEDQAVLLRAMRRLLLQAVASYLPRAARVRPHAEVQRLRQDIFAQQQSAEAPSESRVQFSALLMRFTRQSYVSLLTRESNFEAVTRQVADTSKDRAF